MFRFKFLRVLHLNVTGFRSFSRKHGRISKVALERSIGTIPPNRSGPPPNNIILTLDPKKFVEKKQNRFYIGNLKSVTAYVSLPRQSWPVRGLCFGYMQTRLTRLPFPPNTNAFLYYSNPPEKPRIAGELRLRVTSSDDPASFETGSDLLRSNDRPWSRPLYAIRKHYNHVYESLREDQLVSDDLDAILSFLSLEAPDYRQSHYLYTLNDAFILDFSKYELPFFIITEQGMERLNLVKLFFDGRRMIRMSPYTGSALARFERSTLTEHEGTRTVVLRFLKIITPVKCVIPDYDDRICRPEEGALYRRARLNRAGGLIYPSQVWSINIDMPKVANINTPRGLQLLWDT